MIRLAVAAAAGVLALLLGLAALAGAVAGGGTTAACTTASSGAGAGGLDEDQRGYAAVIIEVAREMRLPPRAAVIGIATALQESGLRNLRGGDRDSLGLFQQRPSQEDWGTPAEILDPAHASRSFYQHLVRVPGWQRRPLTEVAATVQRPAAEYADRYARHETRAQAITAAALTGTGGSCRPGGPGQRAVSWAMTQLGKPYVWGAEGPGAYDCSGLTLQAWKRAGVTLTRTTYTQIHDGQPIGRDQLSPGDLVFFDTDSSVPGPDHVGLYAGAGKMVHAPNSRETVKVEKLRGNPYYEDRFTGAVRPGQSSPSGG